MIPGCFGVTVTVSVPVVSGQADAGTPLVFGEWAFHELTARELQVLWLLADGSMQDEIANLLFISPRTVGTHIQNILGKLDVHSRAQAVSAAHRHGLARPEDVPELL